MTRMTGIILIVIGLLISTTGIWILMRSSKTEIIDKHQEANLTPVDGGDITISSDSVALDESDKYKKAGLEFEKYVVLKFSKEHFSLKNWAGDKYVEGRYAETSTQPDLLLDLKVSGKTYPLAVECKWRRKPGSDFIQFANEGQLQRYQAFEIDKKIPTFIVLGVGGTPSSPEAVYIIPVKRFSKYVQYMDNLKSYKRSGNRNFSYAFDKQILE
jgi:hypothetical protein